LNLLSNLKNIIIYKINKNRKSLISEKDYKDKLLKRYIDNDKNNISNNNLNIIINLNLLINKIKYSLNKLNIKYNNYNNIKELNNSNKINNLRINKNLIYKKYIKSFIEYNK
jgi:hypothetical protein